MRLQKQNRIFRNPIGSLLVVVPIVFSFSTLERTPRLESYCTIGHRGFGSQAILVYVGKLSIDESSELLGVEVYIDTTIGVRYDLTSNAASSQSHVAIFFKFSDPTQPVLYNHTTHRSYVKKMEGSPASHDNVKVMGKETITSYPCTHLQRRESANEIDDYWMSPNIPGFSKIVNTLKAISADLPSFSFNGTVFQWGGLVQWTHNFMDETGHGMNLELHLQEANEEVKLDPKTFEAPTN